MRGVGATRNVRVGMNRDAGPEEGARRAEEGPAEAARRTGARVSARGTVEREMKRGLELWQKKYTRR